MFSWVQKVTNIILYVINTGELVCFLSSKREYFIGVCWGEMGREENSFSRFFPFLSPRHSHRHNGTWGTNVFLRDLFHTHTHFWNLGVVIYRTVGLNMGSSELGEGFILIPFFSFHHRFCYLKRQNDSILFPSLQFHSFLWLFSKCILQPWK